MKVNDRQNDLQKENLISMLLDLGIFKIGEQQLFELSNADLEAAYIKVKSADGRSDYLG